MVHGSRFTVHGSRFTALFYPKFPLYKNDGKPSVNLTPIQRKAIDDFMAKVSSGMYTFEDNPCMCGAHDDVCVTEKDRYGIPCRYVLCRHCGLVRQERRLDDASTALFYRDDYRSIYEGRKLESDEAFTSRSWKGDFFLSFVEEHLDISQIHKVFEAGCGAGWILYAFHKRGITASGCDFGENYLKYGRSKGLDLYEGEPDPSKTPPNSQDVVILSHVLEHLSHPLEYVNSLIELIAPGGYLLGQLPGIFAIGESYVFPIRYFQNAHVNNFYGHYLVRLFEALGLEVVYIDEVCTFLLRKPEGWTKRNPADITIWDEEMPAWAEEVAHALKKFYVYSYFTLARRKTKRLLVKVLELLHLKTPIKKLLGRQ